jgi:AcrR family transcriptional regulator
MTTISRRDHLIETAIRLFTERGFHATGIDTIIAEAGVAKMTLYNHFKSKEDLIVEALRTCSEKWSAEFAALVESRATDPEGRLLAVFDVLALWHQAPDFCGCPFIKAANEFADESHPVHQAARAYVRQVRSYLADLARQAGLRDPEPLASQIQLLMLGSTGAALALGGSEPAETAKAAARVLIDQHR